MQVQKYDVLTLADIDRIVPELWNKLVTSEYCRALHDSISRRIDEVIANKGTGVCYWSFCAIFPVLKSFASEFWRFRFYFIFCKANQSTIFNKVPLLTRKPTWNTTTWWPFPIEWRWRKLTKKSSNQHAQVGFHCKSCTGVGYAWSPQNNK